MFKLWLENEESTCTLKISKPNAKIPHYNFNLPAGFTCPFASKCLSKADPTTGKLTDGPNIDFRCSAAGEEARYPPTRAQRWSNFEALKAIGLDNVPKMADAIVQAINHNLPRSHRTFRLHASGDFFNKNYLKAWIEVARRMPDITFYTYTKSIPYILENLPLPNNFLVTVSKGGQQDALIDRNGLKFSVVVFSEEEAANYVWHDKSGKQHVGLEIDHDDSHAWKDDKPFALLIHGTQPAGSPASKAKSALAGKGSYGKSSNNSSKTT
jgi:hypothetical protein